MVEPRQGVALYVRVSTEEQAEYGYSIDAQLDTLRTFCKLHGKTITDEYVERGVSGTTIEGRPELLRMLHDAERGNFSELLVWRINRLSRKQLDLMQIMKQLEQLGVGFESFTEKFDTSSPMGKFALQMMGAVGELERNTIVENVKSGMKQRARRGQWNGGIVLGYETTQLKASGNRRERVTTLEVVPEEAAIVRRIFEMYGTSGLGLKAIANRLNHEGHRTKKGNPFSVYGVSEILRNPLYVGKIRYNVRENWAEKRRKGINKHPIIADGEHQPIVSQELWDQVQALYDKKSGRPPRVFQGSFPLTGLLRCPQCGSGMVAHRVKDTLKDGAVVYRRSYVCGAFRNKGSAVCKSNGVRADEAEQAVFDRLKEAVVRPNVLRDVVDRVNARRSASSKPLASELKSVEKELEQLNGRKERWYRLYEEDGMERDMLVGRLNELKAQGERLEARRSELRAELATQNDAPPVPRAVVKATLTHFHRLLQNAPPEQQKALLHLLVKRIEVKGRSVGAIELTLDERLQETF
ncbi:recombinase family protein [Alicyclobacillus sp. ALC3]|uniref:recombinase family protein n=1 Tax=Alicyclobacillus sp. ALC3 TaxID=2796143 RepID=UPI00237859FF|nr:recombinase family protein [Alicyclobacillus sp. ALC3]WDL99183.1 recombinase family protein [Alicyclobacillus sp. ALC3]